MILFSSGSQLRVILQPWGHRANMSGDVFVVATRRKTATGMKWVEARADTADHPKPPGYEGRMIPTQLIWLF